MSHEDDCPNEENVNVVGYPFEKFGYTILSLKSSYFDLFLSYKIERAVFPGFEIDTDLSLNAVTPCVIPLDDFKVSLKRAKFKYLKLKKIGKLRKAGIGDLSCQNIALLIKERIIANYIYNLRYLEEYIVVLFNLMIEVPRASGEYPTRHLVAMKYLHQRKTLRVTTLY